VSQVQPTTADRYQRQTLLPQIGPSGQRRLAQAKVLVLGCGALGSVIAEQLVRAGVGSLTIADRDIVETSNLQRQVLFDEDDAQAGTPKAIAAAKRLARVNSTVRVRPLVVDVHSRNIERVVDVHGSERPDVILDGSDNAETRYLLNDLAVKHALPWVYGACVGTEGRVMTILPGDGPCLRCIFPSPPAPGELPTCDTVGVLGSAAAVVASLQVAAALRLLLEGRSGDVRLTALDVWTGRFYTVDVREARRPECRCCGAHGLDFLDAPAPPATTLCGRGTVQLRPVCQGDGLTLSVVADRLRSAGAVAVSEYVVRCALHSPAGVSLSVFPDGRVLVHGVADESAARSLSAKLLGT